MRDVVVTRDLPSVPGDGPVAIDIETTGLSHVSHDVVTVTVCPRGGQPIVVDVRGLHRDTVGSWIRDVVYPRGIIVHNSIFDLVFLAARYECGYPSWVWDTKLVEQVLTAGRNLEASLAATAKRRLGVALDKSLQTSFSADGELSQGQVEYAALDAVVLWPIAEQQLREVQRYGLTRVVALEHAAARAFWLMQERGVGVDLGVLGSLAEVWQRERDNAARVLEDTLTKHVYQYRVKQHEAKLQRLAAWEQALEQEIDTAGTLWEQAKRDATLRESLRREWVGLSLGKRPVTEEEFASWFSSPKGKDAFLRRVGQRFRQRNPRPPVPRIDLEAVVDLHSPKQLHATLVSLAQELGVDAPADTRSQTLRALLGENQDYDAVILGLLRWRELDKLCQFAEQVAEHTVGNRLYPDWQQLGAATGRASCRNPNLMAQPKKDGFRRAFVAAPGHVLIACDYSQIELRIAAALSGDEEMLRAFREGLDLHTLTATRIFRVSENAVTEKQRKVAKQVNFGTLYGMGPKRLVSELAAQGVRITLEEAREALDAWREAYRGAAAFLAGVGEKAVIDGYSVTALGRRRWYDGEDEAAIRRQAGNHPIQGTAADCMKLAMSRLAHRRPVVQVHDELVLEVPAEEASEALVEVQETMVTAAQEVLGGKVPIAVDGHVSVSWHEGD